MLLIFNKFGGPMLVSCGCAQFLQGLLLLLQPCRFIFIIMLYCSSAVNTEIVFQTIKSIAYLVTSGFYVTHNALSLYFIPPNVISNAYHICILQLGKGTGAYSCS